MASGLSPLLGEHFSTKVLDSKIPVLVEFGAPWCGACKMIEPVLIELASEYAGKVDFYSVDVDEMPALVMDYGIMGVPTLILFRDGKPLHRLTGYRPKTALIKAFLMDL